jgi:hypothetical protein
VSLLVNYTPIYEKAQTRRRGIFGVKLRFMAECVTEEKAEPILPKGQAVMGAQIESD